MITLRAQGYTDKDFLCLLQMLQHVNSNISCTEDCENCEHRHACKDLLLFEKFLYSKTNIRKK